MKITTKKPLRPRGRNDEKRQSTKDAIREVYANGPQLEVQIIPAKKDLATDKEQRKLRVCDYYRVSAKARTQASCVYKNKMLPDIIAVVHALQSLSQSSAVRYQYTSV